MAFERLDLGFGPVGIGLTGAGIAAVCSQKGIRLDPEDVKVLETNLQVRDHPAVAAAGTVNLHHGDRGASGKS